MTVSPRPEDVNNPVVVLAGQHQSQAGSATPACLAEEQPAPNAYVPSANEMVKRPALARVYNGASGGAMTTAADRELLAKVLELVPGYRFFVAANRAFVRAAIHRFLDEGITQLLDLGCGMFFDGLTHEIAQSVTSAARVVYVDTDLAAIAHLQQTTEGSDRVGVVHADMCGVDAVLNAPVVRKVLDVDRPVGLLAAAVLHCVPDSDVSADVATVMRRYHDALAPGSMLALSHASGDSLPADIVAQAINLFKRAGITIVSRTRQEICDLLRPWQPEPAGVAELAWQVESGETVYAHGYTVIARSVHVEARE